jgi:Protein of unknown function (DUF2934)
MSDRKNGSQYDNHQRAAEMHDAVAHAHRVGEHQGKSEHLTGHEQSQHALEHSQEAHELTQGLTVGHGVIGFSHDQMAALAYEFWLARGCPEGSPEIDWYRAAEQLRSTSRAR